MIYYLFVINVITFAAFGLDKRKAKKRKFRIRESVLLGLALIGGSLGAMAGMFLFHHKTRKPAFRIGIPVLFLLQGVIWILIAGMEMGT
ncbi:DUF1294 domain-containing protein [Mordavella massiliensis]|jgi:uncharacterized membrane protein YsdA (DUF1294 family)|uniref:DUF1294 domain-containing protein n=1 Tax=Mordavella massiliensis TaxID=1871024 RepID=A0A938X2H9_9CLOT|nr:DUF1294 domain-containing protein [Mordavella massiliensis]MBM6826783.1 DUF1294 domain-containing protein [Mordavella massiliensis]MBM6970210.1 DUF1294 domain-containing protein [Mordavella massiliensis]